MLASFARFVADYNYSYNNDYTVNSHSELSSGAIMALVIAGLVSLVLIVLVVVAIWKMFVKAGKPGWAALIPFYNSWVMAEVAGKPGWWGLLPLLAFIPFLGWIIAIVVGIIIALGLAKNFGKSEVFGIFGLWLFSIVGYMILGFGSATYRGAGAGAGSSQAGSPAEPPASLEGPSPVDAPAPPKPPTKLVQ
jgi:hypothetical protein